MLPRALSKRQRSQSAESIESTSSNKRSNSGSSYSPVPATTTSHQHTTSARMAAMDLNNSTAASAAVSTDGSSSSSTEPLRSENGEVAAGDNINSTGPIPARAAPPEDGQMQLSLVLDSAKKLFVEGDTWFVVDRRWYRRWQAACGSSSNEEGDESNGKELQDITMSDVGPVDNSRISDTRTGKLTKPVVEGQDVVFLPGEAWHFLEAWYGTTGTPISANVIQARDGLLLDLRPPVFTIIRVVPSNSPDMAGSPKVLQTSSSWTIKMLKQIIAQLLEAGTAHPSRLWVLEGEYSNSTIKPEALAHASLEPAGDEDIIRDSSITEDSVIAFEQPNEDGSWLVDASAANDDANATTAAAAAPAQLNNAATATPFGGPSFLDGITKSQPKRAVLTTVGGTSSSADQPVASTSNLGAGAATMRQTRSQTGASSGKKGLVGLTNLGNTCFMNSALQCLSNTPALQEYFHSGLWESELNPQNLLGMKGEVAKAYGNLVDRIWNGSNSVVTPREFKQTLSRFAPAFSGWQQHDSQELIAFLLDGLHEDLNRIKQKPYDDIPDWNGGGEKEELELANLSWELYKRRNDSVIVDLFQGQLRNRLTCPECGKIAIKFDPFMYLSLAIPQHKKWTGDVYLVPNDPARATVNVSLELPANASFKKLKQAVGDLTGYDPKRLFAMEEYTHKFYKVWSDTETVHKIASNDLIVLHELPYEIEQPQYRPTKGKTPEEEGKIFCTVLSKVAGGQPQSTYMRDRFIGEPFILALTAEEACNIEVIERKLGAKLASWQAVGDRIWASPSNVASSKAKSASSKAGRNVISDDEEGSDGADAIMAETDIQTSTEQVKPSHPSSLLNREIVEATVAKRWSPSTYGPQPFVDASTQERITLRERLRLRQQKLEGPSHTRLPGSFTQDDSDDLYGDADEGKEEVSDEVERDAYTSPSPVTDEPLFNTGEIIFVEWKSEFVTDAFGTEAEKSRQVSSSTFTKQERLLDPVIAERNKLGNRKSEKSVITVDNLLDEFVKEEKLNEDNMWYCSACKKHQEAPKKFDLWKMPDVLVIHLKRFSNERAFRDKIDTLIDFPVSGLDLTERVEGKKVAARLAAQGGPADLIEETGTNDSLVYDLFAVDNHFGGLGGGHYTAFAKNIMDGKWYNFDDSRVTPVSNPDEVKTSAAYLLFYVRRTSKPIGGKTHKILASRTVTPAMSSAGSRPVSPAVDLGGSQLHGSSSLRPPPYAYGTDAMEHSTLHAELDELTDEGDMFDTNEGLSSLAPPSPALSEDEEEDLINTNGRGFMSRGVNKIHDWIKPPADSNGSPASMGSTSWNFGINTPNGGGDATMISNTSSPKIESGSTSPSAVEIRLDEDEMARAASSVDMGTSSHMDEVE